MLSICFQLLQIQADLDGSLRYVYLIRPWDWLRPWAEAFNRLSVPYCVYIDCTANQVFHLHFNH